MVVETAEFVVRTTIRKPSPLPYIKPDKRAELRDYDWTPLPQTAGELNYVFSRLIDRVLGNDPSYGDINTVVGVLECCKEEVYRRIAVKFEDRKIIENGDVFRERS
jgi:hypothetical protein